MENPGEKPQNGRKGKKAQKVATANGDSPDNGGRKQFRTFDYNVLCAWLEIEGNLDSVEGKSGKTKIGGKFPTKKRAFEAMAEYINTHQFKGSTLEKVDWVGARNRFLLLQKKYKDTKPIVDSTGWGLTATDEANGIGTIEAKLESMCPCYAILDKIYGGDPNVNFQDNVYCTPKSRDIADFMPWSGVEDLTADDGDTVPSPETEDTPASDGDHPPAMSVPPIVISMPTGIPVTPGLEDNAAVDSGAEHPPANDGNAANPNVANSNVASPDGNAANPNVANSNAASPDGNAAQSAPRGAGSVSRIMKDKGGVNKKRSLDKGDSVTSAFAAGLASISQNKAASNALKERSYDLVFSSAAADRALRAETAQKNFDVQIEKLRVQERRIALEEKRISASSQRDLMLAQLQLMLSAANGARTPDEMREMIQMPRDANGMGSGPST